MRSSYTINDYGPLIEEYVLTWQPSSYVELGVLDGYSTLHIAKGLKRIHQLRGWKPTLDAYDLFDDYQFKHGNKEEVADLLKSEGVSDYVNLQSGDAYKVHANYPDVTFDKRGVEFLHIDISNTGKVLSDIMALWHPKISGRAIVMIEGGSEERDNVGWMKKFDKPSIKAEIESSELINKYYHYGTYFRYPSLTVLLRKWWDVK